MTLSRRHRIAAVVAALALINAAFGGFVGLAAGADPPPPPAEDHFYKPPHRYKHRHIGSILRSRRIESGSFGGISENLDAWQLLYRTKNARRKPEATVATILEPKGAAPDGPRPLVAYQEAEDSLGTQCAPSYQLRAGAPSTNSVEQAEMLIISGLLEHGYAVVVPDYEGPRPSYGSGLQSGRAVLDAIRAAERFHPAGLAGRKTPVGMMGYSGGALATSWASEQAPRYAPKLHIKGVAEGGVPVNFAHAAAVLNKSAFAGYYLAVTVGLSRQYPKFRRWLFSILTPEGRQAYGDIGTMCNSDIVNHYAFKDIADYTTVDDPVSEPTARKLLRRVSLTKHAPKAPLFIYHAINDELLPGSDVDGLVQRYCAEGVRVKYIRDEASEHIALVATGAPEAFAWMADRLSGQTAPAGCTTTTALSTALSPEALIALAQYLAGLAGLFGP